MVSDLVYTDLADAIVWAVNIADEAMTPSRSSKKSISIMPGEYEGQIKRVWMVYGAKAYEHRVYNIYDFDVYKEKGLGSKQ